MPDGQFNSGTVAATVVASPVRTGGFAASCASGAGNADSFVRYVQNGVASTSFYFRAYFCFAQLPGTDVIVMILGTAATNGVSLRVTTGGKVRVFNEATGLQVGSDSAATIVADSTTWYRFEVSTTNNGSNQQTNVEGQLDGVQIAASAVAAAANATLSPQLGWSAAPGATKTVYIDDVALNDSNGAAQNSFPGSGSVVLLVPTADSARGTGWVNDANGTTNFFDATDNKPPAGIADTTSSTGLHQIRNGTSNANSSYDATMQSYTAGGVPTGATVNVVDPLVATGAPVTTSAKTGTVGVVSNPAIANIDLSDVGGTNVFYSGANAATYPTGWKFSHGTATYAPSVTLGTAPVMRITQVTSSTRIAMVCFMGIYVDYTPAATGFVADPIEARYQQAVYRAATF